MSKKYMKKGEFLENLAQKIQRLFGEVETEMELQDKINPTDDPDLYNNLTKKITHKKEELWKLITTQTMVTNLEETDE